MFFITNQFPLVVVKEMMKQSFFQDLLKRGKWKRPKDLQRIVVYDTLVEPHLQGREQQQR
uniref:Uncharacterized protein n=1 Tax=Nelumbo nucifera TaxID=4432 RepID=A0A822YQL8_NELNU|nr:TPA_asm: hypothetical protein HUJ06_011977 [Nelumbo nucifera]